MREFLALLKANSLLENSIVPIGDGVSISVKKPAKKEEDRKL